MSKLSYCHKQNCFMLDGDYVPLTDQDISLVRSLNWMHEMPLRPDMRPVQPHPQAAFNHPEMFFSHYNLRNVNFEGKSVLDIGCWDGFATFYAEACGATRAVGIDDLTKRVYDYQARSLTKRVLQSNAEFYDCNVYDLSIDKYGAFDIVMMFGVIYHLIHPMLGIEKATDVCKEQLLVETHYVPIVDDIPVCMLYPDRELSQSTSNLSGPNLAWMRQAFDIYGFELTYEYTVGDDRATFHTKRIVTKHQSDPAYRKHRPFSYLAREHMEKSGISSAGDSRT